jgi:hypothetical protein
MKKSLFGVIAIVLAISFSAFTSRTKPATGKSLSNLYWYFVSGGQTTSLVFGDGQQHPKAGSGGAIDVSGCPDDLNQPVCAAGFATMVGSGYTNIPTNDDELVRHEKP